MATNVHFLYCYNLALFYGSRVKVRLSSGGGISPEWPKKYNYSYKLARFSIAGEEVKLKVEPFYQKGRNAHFEL